MSKKIDPRFPPQLFKVSIYSPIVIVDYLSTEDRDSLWEHLKDSHSQKARGFVPAMSDPFVEVLMDKDNGLGALLAIEPEYVPDHLKKHQHIL